VLIIHRQLSAYKWLYIHKAKAANVDRKAWKCDAFAVSPLLCFFTPFSKMAEAKLDCIIEYVTSHEKKQRIAQQCGPLLFYLPIPRAPPYFDIMRSHSPAIFCFFFLPDDRSMAGYF